ncbi:MAG TPA: plastocyanin/azurin family copper-binding protein [Solirubrobacterales bacterium]|jgi:plastocyanin
MSNGDLFYICGIALAVSAVLFSFLGLRAKEFPGRFGVLIVLWFVLLIGGTTTYSVLHAQDEETAKAAELESANEEITKEEASPIEVESEKAPAPKPEPATGAPGDTLQLAASPSDLTFDKTSLASKPGKVTIDFDNPAALEHNVAIEQEGKEIAVSETLTEGKTSVSADLAPGTYAFLCTVPGHAEAGMEGVLTVR